MRDQFSFDTLTNAEVDHLVTRLLTRDIHPKSSGLETLTFDNLADEVSESFILLVLLLQCHCMPPHGEQAYHYHTDSAAVSRLGKIRL